MSGKSAFKELGLKKTLALIHEEIRELYALDETPWIIGYSGGKDSTACVQLVWNALAEMPKTNRHKVVHVISTDTQVENPIVSTWVGRSLDVMKMAAEREKMPVHPHQLRPRISDTFWVNLLGKGYPAPRHMFRWCTERLKIRPSNAFITDMVKDQGEAILVLGTRKQESATRAHTMAKHAKNQVRERLTPNASLSGSLIYTPIEDWSNDDVWTYLTQVRNPWDYPNEHLLGMYAGATEGGECPLVVDSSTPSCGDSRFGCWVCTLVDKDKSMTAMIQNDAEKEWMLPLLELRNELDMRDQPGDKEGEGLLRDRARRDFRRMNGDLHHHGRDRKAPDTSKAGRRKAEARESLDRALVHGPYVQEWREQFLKKLLEAQEQVRVQGGETMAGFNLISQEELEAIRTIWVFEKHEIEDSLPRIYEAATRRPYPGPPLDDQCPLDHEALALLKEVTAGLLREGEVLAMRYGLVREMLAIESTVRTERRRAGLIDRLEQAVDKHKYWNEHDAALWAETELKAKRAGERYSQEREDQAEVTVPLFPEDDAPMEPGLNEAFA